MQNSFQQLKKETLYTVIGFTVFAVLWVLLGFGLSSSELAFWGVPLWAWGASLGVLVAAMLVAGVLARVAFGDARF